MKYTKNGVFYFFLVITLVLFQIFYSHWHRITTFHDRTERYWIQTIEKTFEILDGPWDSQIGSSSQAIFAYQVTPQKKMYIAIARYKEKQEDVLLLVDPGMKAIKDIVSLSPYMLQKNNNLDFRGLMDIDFDKNFELVLVVNGNIGKRILVFSLSDNIEPKPFPMLENYHRIQLKDLNQDGITEIIALHKQNRMEQPPSLFHYQNRKLQWLDNADFPLFMNQYLLSLEAKKQLYRSFHNQTIQVEIMLAEMKYHISMGNINQAVTQYSTMVTQLPDSGMERKLPVYRGKMLLAFAFFKTGNLAMMDTILQEAVRELLSDQQTGNKLQSQFFAEKGMIYLQTGYYKEAEVFSQKALRLDPNNALATQLKESLPRQYST